MSSLFKTATPLLGSDSINSNFPFIMFSLLLKLSKWASPILVKIPYFGLGTIMSLIAATIIVIDTFYIEKNNNKKTTRKKINKKEK